MSLAPSLKHAPQGRRLSWSGMAVVVEAMVLLTFLIASLAVIVQLFALATTRAQEGQRLAEAVAYATSTAERFASDPLAAEGTTTYDDLIVVCKVEDHATTHGTLYQATITVVAADTTESVYELATSRYQEGVQP